MKEYLINRSDTPAFPLPNMNTGMTLRDYFAAKAMQALIDNDNLFFEIPTRAYEIADAMMKAREA
jgi:hypothetical protein